MPSGRHKNHARGSDHGMYRHGDALHVNGRQNFTPEYISWRAMKARCLNPNATNWKHYGGRGITICRAWLNDYTIFLRDMGRKPTPKHTLERIDNDGNYNKKNCYWATRVQQVRNRPYVKLSLQIARQIRKDYNQGMGTQRAIAARYGISQGSVAFIISNETWKE